MKKILPVAAVIAVIAAVLLFVNFRSAEDSNAEHTDETASAAGTVTLSVRCDTVLDNYDKLDGALKSGGYIPDDGVILESTQYAFEEGDTVFDILASVSRRESIQMEYGGGSGSEYIEGIGYLYEFSCGRGSGWNYRVNGEYPGVGCGQYKPSDGDEIEWLYTCDFGRDIGSYYGGGDG